MGKEFEKEYIYSFLCVCVCACAPVLSCFSRVQLFVTPWTIAHQAPLSMEFSRQEYWSRLPCPPHICVCESVCVCVCVCVYVYKTESLCCTYMKESESESHSIMSNSL